MHKDRRQNRLLLWRMLKIISFWAKCYDSSYMLWFCFSTILPSSSIIPASYKSWRLCSSLRNLVSISSSWFTFSFKELISSSILSFLLSHSLDLWGESLFFSSSLSLLLFPRSSVWVLPLSPMHVNFWNY